MNDADNIESQGPGRETASTSLASKISVSDLKPKGACWYCNVPLDNIRRFCSKTCAQDYQTEEEAFR